jgi:hypothetical protein
MVSITTARTSRHFDHSIAAGTAQNARQTSEANIAIVRKPKLILMVCINNNDCSPQRWIDLSPIHKIESTAMESRQLEHPPLVDEVYDFVASRRADIPNTPVTKSNTLIGSGILAVTPATAPPPAICPKCTRHAS